MGSNRAKTVASAALLGFIAGYVLAFVQTSFALHPCVLRKPSRFSAPLSTRIQDTIDRMEAAQAKLGTRRRPQR